MLADMLAAPAPTATALATTRRNTAEAAALLERFVGVTRTTISLRQRFAAFVSPFAADHHPAMHASVDSGRYVGAFGARAVSGL